MLSEKRNYLRWGSLATVLKVVEPVWLGDYRLDVGDKVGSEWIKLVSGEIQLLLPTSGVLSISGPSKLRIELHNGIELLEGMVGFRYCSPSEEFLIRTPDLELSVFDGNFTVTVKKDGVSHVAVSRGSLQVYWPARGTAQPLFEGQEIISSEQPANGNKAASASELRSALLPNAGSI